MALPPRVAIVTSQEEEKAKSEGHIRTEGPWETVSVDVVGPLPEDQGKRFLVVFMDCFSGYCLSLIHI